MAPGRYAMVEGTRARGFGDEEVTRTYDEANKKRKKRKGERVEKEGKLEKRKTPE